MILAEYVLTAAFRGYQLLVSPLLPPSCRYYPSCSSYGLQAIKRWGVAKGLWLSLHRLFRCHPWASGGLDPVPIRSDGNQR